MRAPAIVFAVIDVVLTSQRERRTSGPENFQSLTKKDFFNIRRGPSAQTGFGPPGDLPVPVRGVCAHARFFDHAPDPALSRYIPWLWNTFWQLLLSFVRFCCKHC
jgi:hypothetical protein